MNITPPKLPQAIIDEAANITEKIAPQDWPEDTWVGLGAPDYEWDLNMYTCDAEGTQHAGIYYYHRETCTTHGPVLTSP